MGKYKIDKNVLETMAANESKKKGGGSFFSSKEDNENYFSSDCGKQVVVGLEPRSSEINGTRQNFNVVQFDSGMEMSTSRFFTAKGLRWPIGGNTGKLRYLASALAVGKKIEVMPDKVVSEEREIKSGNRAGEKFNLVTYHFAPQALPEVDIVDFDEEA